MREEDSWTIFYVTFVDIFWNKILILSALDVDDDDDVIAATQN